MVIKNSAVKRLFFKLFLLLWICKSRFCFCAPLYDNICRLCGSIKNTEGITGKGDVPLGLLSIVQEAEGDSEEKSSSYDFCLVHKDSAEEK